MAIGTNRSNTLSIIPPRGYFFLLFKMKNLLFKPIFLIRYFSTYIKAKPLNLMDPYFFTGFSVAESSFIVSIWSKSNSKGEVKLIVEPEFQIGLSYKDEELLIAIKASFEYYSGSGLSPGKVGRIQVSKNKSFLADFVPSPKATSAFGEKACLH